MTATTLKAILGAAGLALVVSCSGTGTGASGSTGGLPPGTHLAFIASYTSKVIQSYAINASNGALTALGSSRVTQNAPYAVVVTPDGKFVYVSNQASASVSSYAVNADGSLTAKSTYATLTFPEGMAMDRAGHFLYVACHDSDAVCGFQINTDGSLTALDANPGTPTLDPFPAGNGPASVVVDPQNGFVVVGNVDTPSLGLYSFNPSTGMLALLNTTTPGGTPSAVAMNAAGTQIFATESGGSAVDAFSLNRTTHAVASLGSALSGGTPVALAMDPTGTYLYSANYGGNTVTAFAIGSGGLSYPGGTEVDSSTGLNPAGLATDGPDRILFVNCYSGNTTQAFGINTDGSLVALGAPQPTVAGPQGIAIY